MTLKVAVIVDNAAIQRFALDALDAITDVDDLTVYSCTNTRIQKRWFRHAAYYALNLLTIRNRLTCLVPVAIGRKKVARIRSFASDYDGAWQVLPLEVIGELKSFDVILKFGMGLLKVPQPETLPPPILSYHHGDPDLYRGRPAGFWEIVEGAPAVGQVIQVLGNKLDAGRVVAFAETKVFSWSYRATLLEAYRHSPLIINEAIRNALSGTYLPKTSEGRNCRLPSNTIVIAFVVRMATLAIRRILYGAFQEKAWQVSTTRLSSEVPNAEIPPPNEWDTYPNAASYRFYADPFFADDGILVEALSRRSGLGEIVSIGRQGDRPLIAEPGHLSYPAVTTVAGRQFVIPETASWSSPRIYSLSSKGAEFSGGLHVEGNARVSDPTLFEWKGRIFLFGNDRDAGSNVLHLWSSDTLEGKFALHPRSPIRISPLGSRMGGNIIEKNGRLYRLGQDFTGDYGNGLILFEIEELSRNSYSESPVRRIRFTDRKGPHTLNVRGEEVVFDWYRNRIAPLAGFRRLVSTLQRRRRPHATQ